MANENMYEMKFDFKPDNMSFNYEVLEMLWCLPKISLGSAPHSEEESLHNIVTGGK